jgi:hypothetical protein
VDLLQSFHKFPLNQLLHLQHLALFVHAQQDLEYSTQLLDKLEEQQLAQVLELPQQQEDPLQELE